nr:type I-E CRISPR-associated protein Cse2/CasB [Deinobacterium chartae]
MGRGELAELRRSLSARSGASYRLERPIFEHLPARYHGGWGHDAAFLVAGLYALVERPTDRPDTADTAKASPSVRRNLGHDLGRLYRLHERPSTEKRFLALLDTDETQLPYHLRYAVTLLNAEDIRPDWARLLADIAAWHRPERRDEIRQRWAQAFYRPQTDAPPTESPAPLEENA